LDFSSGVLEVVMDKNPTCGVEAELGIQTAAETALGIGHIRKKNCKTGHVAFLKALQTLQRKQYLSNPVHQSLD